MAAMFISIRSVGAQLGQQRRLGCAPPTPKAPSLIMREGMQVELGLRGVSINTLQIVKRVIRCSAFVCVLFPVSVYMHVKKPPVAHRDGGTGGCERTMVGDPGSLPLIGGGLLIGHPLGVIMLRLTAGGPAVTCTHEMQTCVCLRDRMMHFLSVSMEKKISVKDILWPLP